MSREVNTMIGRGFEAASPSRRPSAIDLGSRSIDVLSVSPIQDDHDSLERILNPTQWVIQKAHSLESGVAKLRQYRFPVVVCERDLRPGTWREMLAEAAQLLPSPFLIVTCRLADEYLWAEALNVGAYDVLAKPFDAAEVTRVVSLAWLHWEDLRQFDCAGVQKTMPEY